MALIWPFGVKAPVSEADLSGAKLRVRVANTNTLASLFSDNSLSVALSNPVIANADGLFTTDGSNECAVYVASGVYDVAILNAADEVLPTVDDYSPWGSNVGDIDVTVTGNARFKVTGSAGALQIQVGSPSPDDVGGELTIEGYAGTQLDGLTLDAATTNVTGRLQEAGNPVASVVKTAATTFTAAANIDIALPEIVNGIRGYRVDLFDLVKSTTTGNIRLRLAYDGVPNFKTGAADYHSYVLYGSAGGVVGGTGAAAAGYAEVGISPELTSGRPGWLAMEILTPESGANPTIVRTMLHCMENGSISPTIMYGTQYGLGSYGRATHLRIYADTGDTFTGSYRVAPIYGFGGASA